MTAGLVGAILLSAGYVAGGYHYSHNGSGGGNATGFAAARTGTGRTAEGGFGRTRHRRNGSGAHDPRWRQRPRAASAAPEVRRSGP